MISNRTSALEYATLEYWIFFYVLPLTIMHNYGFTHAPQNTHTHSAGSENAMNCRYLTLYTIPDTQVCWCGGWWLLFLLLLLDDIFDFGGCCCWWGDLVVMKMVILRCCCCSRLNSALRHTKSPSPLNRTCVRRLQHYTHTHTHCKSVTFLCQLHGHKMIFHPKSIGFTSTGI